MTNLDFLNQLATQVRFRRKLLGLNQERLAQLAGCGPVFIIDIERAKPSLRLDKLLSVLEVLGLDLSVVQRTPGPRSN